MDESTVTTIFTWLGNHPILSGFFIFFIALIESLAIVGILVPGVVLMVIIGAYLATDQFSLLYAIMLTFAGAVAGDGISYYLGNRYKNKLIAIWPISRYPETFKKGIQFFERHGNKSVILGRFIGPLRPLIPAIAGMFQMSRKQFFFSNVFSALIWAPLVLLPGYMIGLSLEFASDIAGRLILLVVFVGFILWILFWFIKSSYLYILPRLNDGIALLLKWSHKHPLPDKATAILLEQKYPEKNIFIVLFILFVLFSNVFFALPAFYGLLSNINDIDILLSNLFLTFNSPASNQFVHSIQNLINLKWILLLSILIFLILAWKKHRILFRYYLITLILTITLQVILSQYLKIDPNYNLLGISTYLFLTFVLTFNSTRPRKILYYGVCYALITTIMISQLYLGSAHLLPLILGNLFSLLWIVTLTGSYRHHSDSHKLSHQFQKRIGFIFLTLILLNVMLLPNSFNIKPSVTKISIIEKNIWENFVWQELPSYRKGLINKTKHPFNIQFYGDKKRIIEKLKLNSTSNRTTNNHTYAWTLSHSPTTSEIIQSLNPNASIDTLAILPHLHNGTYEQLQFTRLLKDEIHVIRLWKTNLKIKQFNPDKKAQPLWQGTLSKLVIVKRLGIKILQSRLIDEVLFNNIAKDFENRNYINMIKYNKNNNLKVLLLSVK